jgi:hypothetical protein
MKNFQDLTLHTSPPPQHLSKDDELYIYARFNGDPKNLSEAQLAKRKQEELEALSEVPMSNDIIIFTMAHPFVLPSKENADSLDLLRNIPKADLERNETLRLTAETLQYMEKLRTERERLGLAAEGSPETQKAEKKANVIFEEYRKMLQDRPSTDGLVGWRLSDENRVTDLAEQAEETLLNTPLSEKNTAFKKLRITLNQLKPAIGAMHILRKPAPTITDASEHRKHTALYRIAKARYNFWGTETPSPEALGELMRTADEHYFNGILNPEAHDFYAIGESKLQSRLNSRIRQAELNHLNRGSNKRIQIIDELMHEIRPTSKKAQKKQDEEIEKFIQRQNDEVRPNEAGEELVEPDQQVLKLRAQIAQGKLHPQAGHREVALLAEELLDNHIQDSYTPLEAIEEILRIPDADGKDIEIGDDDLRVGPFPVEISLTAEPFSHYLSLNKQKIFSDSEKTDAKLRAKTTTRLLKEQLDILALYKVLKVNKQRSIHLRRDGDTMYWNDKNTTDPDKTMDPPATTVAQKIVGRSQKYRQLRRLLLAEDQRNVEKNLVLSVYPNISERSRNIYKETARIPGAAPEKLVQSRSAAVHFILQNDPELDTLANRVFAQEMDKRQS